MKSFFFFCIISLIFATSAQAFLLHPGDIFTPSNASGIYQVTSEVTSFGTWDYTYEKTLDKLFVSPCNTAYYLKNGKVRYASGVDTGSECHYSFSVYNVASYSPPTPSLSGLFSSAKLVLPVFKFLSGNDRVTAIFNYFFSLAIFCVLIMLPVKWTIRFFRSK